MAAAAHNNLSYQFGKAAAGQSIAMATFLFFWGVDRLE